MTESEWLTSTNVAAMRSLFLADGLFESRGSGRKFRLFVCACCHYIWHLLTVVFAEMLGRERQEMSVGIRRLKRARGYPAISPRPTTRSLSGGTQLGTGGGTLADPSVGPRQLQSSR
jgi:hypothetical protein